MLQKQSKDDDSNKFPQKWFRKVLLYHLVKKYFLQQFYIQLLIQNMKRDEQTMRQQQNPNLAFAQYAKLTVDLLNDLIESEGEQCESIFNSQEKPSISLGAYLQRLYNKTQFSPKCLIIALRYLDRYNMAETSFSLNYYNVHKMILTCLVVAVKFYDDIYFNNLTFQKAGGVPIQLIAKFQLQLFQKMSFDAYVDQEECQELIDTLYNVYGQESQQL